MSKTPNHSRLRLSEAGTLFIDHVKSTDAGPYTCCATSGSTDDATTRLMVYNATAKLVLQTTGSDFVSVTWKGLDSTIASTQYAVLYRHGHEYHLKPSSTSGYILSCYLVFWQLYGFVMALNVSTRCLLSESAPLCGPGGASAPSVQNLPPAALQWPPP